MRFESTIFLSNLAGAFEGRQRGIKRLMCEADFDG
jgi:hypothetical protein